MCLVHPGGPGAHLAYLRIPELEEKLTLVYLDPVGSGDSALLPDGDYSMSRYGRFAEAVLDDIGASTAATQEMAFFVQRWTERPEAVPGRPSRNNQRNIFKP
ncbi:hypothetical protein GA0115259_101803 [Streptomyces sp. MnatMP-M17]|nr:hypothetical protein GA0115259_101803 [Streptomyces sp. MnatMP-M17]